MATYKRKVHDLSSSLDEGNYNPVSFSDANIAVHKATLEKATRKNPAKEFFWIKRFKRIKNDFKRFNRFIYTTQEMTRPTKHLFKHTDSKTIPKCEVPKP